MIRVDNRSHAFREPVPAFLQGLAPESLADLSWTDPALGVADCAWWPEQDCTAPLPSTLHTYGPERFEVDQLARVVRVYRDVVELPPELQAEVLARETAAHNAEVHRKIAEIESKQGRAVREAALGQPEYLQQMEDAISALRSTLR